MSKHFQVRVTFLPKYAFSRVIELKTISCNHHDIFQLNDREGNTNTVMVHRRVVSVLGVRFSSMNTFNAGVPQLSRI